MARKKLMLLWLFGVAAGAIYYVQDPFGYLVFLAYIGFPLGTLAMFLTAPLLTWFPNEFSDFQLLLINISVNGIGFYLQWYVILPFLKRKWQSRNP